MSNYNIFYDKEYIPLVFNNLSGLTNMNLYDRKIKVFKGVDTTIYFNLKNHDRKAVAIPGKTLVCVLINKEMNEIAFTKELVVENYDKGNYQLFIRSCDTAPMRPGHYTGVILMIDNNVNLKEFVYSGEDYNPTFEVEISNSIFPEFRESLKSCGKTWTFNGYVNSWISAPRDSARVFGLERDLYTGCFYLEDAIGTLYVDETYDSSPSMIDESHWVPIYEKEVGEKKLPEDKDYDFDDLSKNWKSFTGNEGFSIRTQGNYFRFRFVPFVNYYNKYHKKPSDAINPVQKVLFRF